MIYFLGGSPTDDIVSDYQNKFVLSFWAMNKNCFELMELTNVWKKMKILIIDIG